MTDDASLHLRARAGASRQLVACVVAQLALGCLEEGHGGFLDAGAADPGAGGASAVAGDAATDAAAPNGRGVYPTEGLGTATGDVIANLELVTADDRPFALRDVHADEDVRVMLVSTAAGWCTACIEEQPKLEGLHRELGPEGVFVLIAYFEDANFSPARARDAARWRERHDLTFTVTADTDNVFGAYYDTALAPMTMVVDVPSMEILSVQTGFDEAAVRALVGSRL
jgi:thiol-disulfide isomerase/thioredoxin